MEEKMGVGPFQVLILLLPLIIVGIILFVVLSNKKRK